MANHRFTGNDYRSNNTPENYKQGLNGIAGQYGVYTAIVVDNADPDYQGHIWVDIITSERRNEDKSTRKDRHKFSKIRTMSPFGGSIGGDDATVTYGATFPPPAIHTEVLVAFTDLDSVGYMLGVLAPPGKNSSVPGLPASQVDNGDIGPSIDPGKQNKNTRPRHPVANAVAEQGTSLDPIRGVGSSGEIGRAHV